jgi:AraC family transcriptional regulator
MLDRLSENPLGLLLHTDQPGAIEAPAFPNLLVCIHVGSSVQTACRRGDQSYYGLAVHGDIDIIPANTPSLWHFAERNSEIILSLIPELVDTVAEQLEFDPRRIEIRNRFQIRDPHLENIGWALKAELECGYPSGRLYLDSLAVAMAARLVTCHSSGSVEPNKQNGSLAGRRLKQVLSFIEDNLSRNISLGEIAAVAGLSVSHFKTLFRAAVGLPVHQYVIRRRIERAKILLSESNLPISQIALETGFAHQSHLAHHMRRVLGISPKAVRELHR